MHEPAVDKLQLSRKINHTRVIVTCRYYKTELAHVQYRRSSERLEQFARRFFPFFDFFFLTYFLCTLQNSQSFLLLCTNNFWRFNNFETKLEIRTASKCRDSSRLTNRCKTKLSYEATQKLKPKYKKSRTILMCCFWFSFFFFQHFFFFSALFFCFSTFCGFCGF